MSDTTEKTKGKFTKYSKATIDALAAKFEQAPKIDNAFTARELVLKLNKPIMLMRDKGYSYKEITEQMSTLGVDISESTLVAALRSIKTPVKKKSAAAKQVADAGYIAETNEQDEPSVHEQE